MSEEAAKAIRVLEILIVQLGDGQCHFCKAALKEMMRQVQKLKAILGHES